MKTEREEVIFENFVQFTAGIKRIAQKFIATDTTPTVKNNELWIANNTGAVTVTQFDEGAEGQPINILGDGFTTIANNANIKTNTGANKLLAANRLYKFVRINSIWYEQ